MFSSKDIRENFVKVHVTRNPKELLRLDLSQSFVFKILTLESIIQIESPNFHDYIEIFPDKVSKTRSWTLSRF